MGQGLPKLPLPPAGALGKPGHRPSSSPGLGLLGQLGEPSRLMGELRSRDLTENSWSWHTVQPPSVLCGPVPWPTDLVL